MNEQLRIIMEKLLEMERRAVRMETRLCKLMLHVGLPEKLPPKEVV